jgi:hypothetical protein
MTLHMESYNVSKLYFVSRTNIPNDIIMNIMSYTLSYKVIYELYNNHNNNKSISNDISYYNKNGIRINDIANDYALLQQLDDNDSSSIYLFLEGLKISNEWILLEGLKRTIYLFHSMSYHDKTYNIYLQYMKDGTYCLNQIPEKYYTYEMCEIALKKNGYNLYLINKKCFFGLEEDKNDEDDNEYNNDNELIHFNYVESFYLYKCAIYRNYSVWFLIPYFYQKYIFNELSIIGKIYITCMYLSVYSD